MSVLSSFSRHIASQRNAVHWIESPNALGFTVYTDPSSQEHATRTKQWKPFLYCY